MRRQVLPIKEVVGVNISPRRNSREYYLTVRIDSQEPLVPRQLALLLAQWLLSELRKAEPLMLSLCESVPLR